MLTNMFKEFSINNNKSFLGICIVCLFGFAVTIISNYPGLMTPDSDFQFLQASSFHFTDWHPPIMALVWSALLKIVDGSVGMLYLFSILYWGSFALIAKSLSTRSAHACILLLIIAFCPFMLNFVGTIWKDVFVFVFFLFGLSIIVRSHFNGVPLQRGIAFILVAIFSVGALARHNAFFSGLILSILCLLYTKKGLFNGLSGLALTSLKGAILFISIFGGMFYAIDNFVKPDKKYASSSLFVYDLVGISIRSNEYLLPKSGNFNVENIKPCYENKGWDKIWVACPKLLDELRLNGDWERLSGYWISAVSKHPALYLDHRVYYFTSFFEPAWLVFNSEPTKTNMEFGFKRSVAFNAMEMYIKGAASTPIVSVFFTNGFWTLLNLLVVIYFFAKCLAKLDRDKIFLFLISLSGLFYSAPLILAGVAPDFRYVYWSIGASLICMPIAISISKSKKINC